MSGCLVVFEGPDGSGKTTQLRRAVDWLTAGGLDVQAIREPGGTMVAESIRSLVVGLPADQREPTTDAFLMNAARTDVVRRVVRPALERGSVVLSDRFAASTCAYQGAGDGVSNDWLRALERLATDGLEPDHYLLFDLDAAEALARRHGAGDLNEIDRRDPAFHRRVRDGYRSMAEAAPDRWSVIDATREPDAIWVDVRRIVSRVLSSRGVAVPA